LERSNQAKDEFLGIIAHELRTPVTTIFGASRLLTNPRRPLPDAARNELIDNLGHESERLVRLVENLLLLARAELGKRPDREEFSVAALATSLAAEVQERTPEREIKLTNGLRTDSIYSERTTIEQVIENLLSNANKYSPPDKPIEIVLEGGVTDLTVRVLDQGPGVKAEELSLLFDSFYRSPSTQSEPGKGLGLAVCKRLIESLGGECWAKMRPGGGLEVGFHIPLSTDDAASRAPEGEPSATTS
jgi:two-component system sensor histidine kinase KdpD